MIPATREYLERLREVTTRLGILLVFDEVVSFRIAWGGAQEYYGVTPDLTILGKLIGGGFPLGALGGRADVMALFDPSTRTAGRASSGQLQREPDEPGRRRRHAGAAHPRGDRRAQPPRRRASEPRLREFFEQAETRVRITGLGSLFAIHPTAQPELRHRIFLGLYNQGVLIDPRGVGTLSTVVGDGEITRFLGALRAMQFLALAGTSAL